MSDLIPVKNRIFGKHIVIADHFFMFHADFFVNIVWDYHIDKCVFFHKCFYCFKNFKQRAFVNPVVAVYYFKIFSCGMRKSAVDCIAVSSVFFLDRLDDRRILSFVPFGDFLRSVFWTIVDDKNFDIFSSDKDWVDRFFHIGFWVITRNCKWNVFHIIPPDFICHVV